MSFHHKNIRLSPTAYIGAKAYFVTLCTAGRRKILATPKLCESLLQLLRQESTTHRFAVLAYCLMPDHMHLLVEGLSATSNLLVFIKSFRIKSSRTYGHLSGEALWQKKFYDHILRSTVSLESVACYIWLNPVRAALTKQAREYPFAGSFTNSSPFESPPERIWKPEFLPKTPLRKAPATRRPNLL
jgi:putative transposase